MIAPRNVAILPQHVEPQRAVAEATERLVDVGRHAPLPIDPDRQRTRQRAFEGGSLADQIDRAGRCGAAVVGARRPLLDLDRFGIEDIARDRAEVADAVDEDAVRRVEAAHTDSIAARRIPVLTRIDGADAGAGAQPDWKRGGE